MVLCDAQHTQQGHTVKSRYSGEPKGGNTNVRQDLDKLVAAARENYAKREDGYRQRSLKMYPWVCGRCMREFDNSNVRELTVHHRDHNHDNNPEDGSNWELLCVFCHDKNTSAL